jgi:hypothetical protein
MNEENQGMRAAGAGGSGVWRLARLALSMAGLSAALAACVNTGLKEAQGISATFPVSADYQAATRRAIEYARVCLERREHPYGAVYVWSIDKGARNAPNSVQVFRQEEEHKILQAVEAKADTPSTATVTVRVLGPAPWDQAELAAAQQSIQTATPVCRPLN